MHWLQHVNADAVVILRDMRDPVARKTFRCVYLLCRVRTASGFLLATRTLERCVAHKVRFWQDEQIQWIDMFTWFLFDRQCRVDDDDCFDAVREASAQVEYGGMQNYGSKRQVAALGIEVLNVATRWESLMVAPIFHRTG